MPVVQCRVSSSAASSKTLRNRSHQLEQVRATVSGGSSSSQLQDEIAHLAKEDREALLSEAALPIAIPTDHSLAMKSDLQIPWNKMRAIRRYIMWFGTHVITVIYKVTKWGRENVFHLKHALKTIGGCRSSGYIWPVKKDKEHWLEALQGTTWRQKKGPFYSQRTVGKRRSRRLHLCTHPIWCAKWQTYCSTTNSKNQPGQAYTNIIKFILLTQGLINSHGTMTLYQHRKYGLNSEVIRGTDFSNLQFRLSMYSTQTPGPTHASLLCSEAMIALRTSALHFSSTKTNWKN